MVKFSRLI